MISPPRLWRYLRSALTNHHEISRLFGLRDIGTALEDAAAQRGQGKRISGGAVCENGNGESVSLGSQPSMGKKRLCIPDRVSEKFCPGPGLIDCQPFMDCMTQALEPLACRSGKISRFQTAYLVLKLISFSIQNRSATAAVPHD